MISPEEWPRRYESLADHFARQGESRQRDECLVLAADAALKVGTPEEAERLRRRLLLTNPHHLLRPYNSMSEAMSANDVRDYVADLRKRWPPETVEQLLNKTTSGTVPLAAPLKTRQATNSAYAAAPEFPVSPGAYWLSVLLFAAAFVGAGALAVVVLGTPFIPWER